MLCQIAAPAHHQRIAARSVPMTKRRILLVSFLFPPNAGIGGLRVGKLAKFLTERGWDVRVLTCESGGAKDLPVEIPAEHIVRTEWFEKSAHFPFLDEPEHFHQSMLQVAAQSADRP